jgi:hypothetical protein
LKYSNGDEFRGLFDKDIKNGQGEVFYSDSNRIIRGILKNNRLFFDENCREEYSALPESELDDISNYN